MDYRCGSNFFRAFCVYVVYHRQEYWYLCWFVGAVITYISNIYQKIMTDPLIFFFGILVSIMASISVYRSVR